MTLDQSLHWKNILTQIRRRPFIVEIEFLTCLDIAEMMDLTEKLTVSVRCAEQSDENAQLQDEISFLRSDYEKEQQICQQFQQSQ